MRSPSPECYTTFWMMTIYSDTLHWSGITPIFDPVTDLDLITKFDFLPNCTRFPYNICNGCGMPTEDAFSFGHLVLSHFGTCKCSNVETNFSWTCLVSGLLSFEHPTILLFCLGPPQLKQVAIFLRISYVFRCLNLQEDRFVVERN